MKITTILLLLCTFSISGNILSQTVSLDLQNVTIRQVFDEIETLTGYKFFYLDEQIDDKRRIDVQASEQSVEDIILKMFRKESIKYKVFENNLVVITPSTEMQQQGITVAGSVISGLAKEPLAGVNVVEKGTMNGTVTDIDGNFTITVEDADAVLVFSYVGYLSEEITIGEQTSLNISMAEDIASLEEVVVIGYGTLRKGDITSAIATVKADEFIQGAVKDAGQLLQGKIAGLAVSSPSGDPRDGVQIMLRGNNTLMASTEPLVIVDGIPGDLELVAPQDIESIDVLKDGSAAAIYGTRGTNGVIIITTKKGSKNMPLTAEYSTYVSTQQISRMADFYDADDYVRMAAEEVDNIDNVGSSTDWLDEITRTPVSHMHDLSVRGGSEKTSYIGTFNYNNSQGIFLKSDVEKITARLDVTHTMFDGKFSVNVGLLTGLSNFLTVDKNYAYRQALIHNPTEPLKNEDGTWFENPSKFQYENPVALLEEADGDNKDRYNRIYGNITLSPVMGLNLKILGSRNVWNQTRGFFETLNHISNIRDNRGGYASRGASTTEDNLLEMTAEYSKTIDVHGFTILGGYSYQDHLYEGMDMNNRDFPSDFFGYDNIGEGNGLIDGVAYMNSWKNMSRLIGFFGRVNYNFSSRYLLQVSIRREGSSKFGENYQWGTFPAIQAGWRISEESFMENVSFVNDLKLRVGYGITGIEPTDPYLSLTLLEYGDRILIDGEWQRTIIPASNPNPDLRWEKKLETNIGLDFGFLGNRINGSVDLYKRNTKDLLWNYSVPTPPYLYGTILANVGEMENQGIELLVNIVPVKTKDLSWTTSINYSTNSNKLVSLTNDLFELDYDFVDAGYTGDPIQQGTHRIYIGESIGDFYGYKSVGVDDEGGWLIERHIEEENLDTIISYDDADPATDKQILGNGLPKTYVGWNNLIQYKNFDLNITMRGAFGFQILNFQRMFYENPTITYNMLETAHDPVYGKDTLTSPQEYVSYYIEDGDYWKIDNITLGYTFRPKNNKVLKSLRIYASALNLATITNYKGIDPEVSRTAETSDPASGWDPGNDNRDKYPTTRTYTIGLNIKF
ncbi:MAG: TonB-dependent receptor [Bacteroidales bacterium]|nr:MAG: TonB-dependent receptor [Bacteroidales bacterium]